MKTIYSKDETARSELYNLLEPVLRIFTRRDARASAGEYIEGLLGRSERKTSWQMSEEMGRLTPYAMQNLLGRRHWDADASMPELQRFVVDSLGVKKSALIVDETGFLKKGDKSAGVQRQYSGTAGRIENCQVGVFLAYATDRGHTLIDRRLFLPESWSQAPARLKSVQAPVKKAHRTKPELAIKMLESAAQNGIKADWVLGDSIYGNSSRFRRWCMDNGQQFAVAVTSTQCIWQDLRQVRMLHLLQTDHEKWLRASTGPGTKGPRFFDWKILKSTSLPMYPGYALTCIARRSVDSEKHVGFFMVFARQDCAMQEMIEAIGQRWKIEECFQNAKSNVGLGHDEVRSWHGWHRHMTLALWAEAYLVHRAGRWRQKKGM